MFNFNNAEAKIWCVNLKNIEHHHSYVVRSISFQTFLYRHLKLSKILKDSVCYCYTSQEMTDTFL